MDSGEYKEYKYYNETNMTEKQKEALPIQDAVTRYFSKPISNQKFMPPNHVSDLNHPQETNQEST
jgi:hypothetical protein